MLSEAKNVNDFLTHKCFRYIGVYLLIYFKEGEKQNLPVGNCWGSLKNATFQQVGQTTFQTFYNLSYEIRERSIEKFFLLLHLDDSFSNLI